MAKTLKLFLFSLIWLAGAVHAAEGSVYPMDLSRFISEANKAGISSLDFRIDVIEPSGIPLDAVTITRRSEPRSLLPVDNGGHLLLTSKNVFMTVTNGIVVMDLMAVNGTFISLVVSSGDSIEFEPYSFTVTSSVTNSKTVAALVKGVKFSISPGESTRFVEVNTMQSGQIAFLDQRRAEPVRLAILGSAYLDVSSIETDSLRLQNIVVGTDVKSYEHPVLDYINEDLYPDLIVDFEANSGFFDHDINYAVLNGHLADGTTIKGIAGPLVSY